MFSEKKIKRFFIIGNPRSGTTLLRLMLNKHSALSVPPEAGFLVWLYNEYKEFVFTKTNLDVFLSDLNKTSKIENWNLDFKHLEEVLIEEMPSDFVSLMDGIYKFYSQYNLSKKVSIYGDKNNYYLSYIDLLNKLYGEAKFIHIIRDGRSVAVSYKNLKNKKLSSQYAPDLPEDIETIAKQWVANIQQVNHSFKKLKASQYYTIKFEDLITEPKRCLEGICQFLEIKFEKIMLHYFETTEKEGLEPKEFLEWKQKNKMPLLKKEAFKYEELTQSEMELFKNHSNNLLLQYGYI